ncbi:transcription initiation factor TFIID subunit 9B-like [Varroa jacobsoni]|uniref:Uncharacterized protein n=1 Tax=Varroa destructor TaxID=109461 RepID=A0A7M7K2T2_VARDE|nr:transcription initiation factor TFIID subunit 9B-like [Varroa destructor]XP_022701513.1 transcription initiation factor TFIID subunit 9B-like [Varroa jacobsoni]
MSAGGPGGSAGSGSRAAHQHTPKDAQVMAALLKDMGVTEYEPKVIDQMLDFSYKYVTNVLEEAKVCSGHAKKRSIDAEDVRLGIQLLCDKSFTNPPPRELLMDVARAKNAQHLPLIKSTTGARLPPDRYTLTSANYRCKTKPRPPAHKLMQTGSQSVLSKTTPAVSLSSKSGATLSVVKKGGSQPSQVTIVSRPTIVQSASSQQHQQPVPRPLIKLSAASSGSSGGPTVNVVTKPKPISVTGMPPINIVSGERKRKAEDEAH